MSVPLLNHALTRRLAPVFLLAAGCGVLRLPVGKDAPPPVDAAVVDATAPGCGRRCDDAGDASRPFEADSTIDAGGVTDASSGGPAQQYACRTGTGWSWCNPQPTGVSLDAVWGSGAADVWAVGAGGVVEHWNGTAWSVVPAPTTLELFSVWGTGPSDAWAVGSNAHGTAVAPPMSVILHWNGTSWAVSQSLADSELWSVWGSSANDVWAVGASDPGAGLFVHWDGSTWTSSASFAASTLYGVWGTGASDAWAVGNSDVRPDASSASSDGTFVPEILHWGGSAWTIAFNNGGAANMASLPSSVWASSPSDVWVATNGSPLHWNGLEWSPVSVPGTADPSFIGGTSADDVWGPAGAGMLHWNGAAWSTSATLGISTAGSQTLSLASVWASSTTDAWAVGDGGALLHWGGSSWSTQSPMPELLSTWSSTSSDAWAVGVDGTALHWDGTAWAETSTGTSQSLTAVWGDSSTDVWTLASDSTVRRWNGTGWVTSVAPTQDPLTAIGGTSATDVWVSSGPNDGGDAGPLGGPSNAGEVFHWDGNAWVATAVPLGSATASWVQAIWAATPSDVWAVGFQARANAFTSSTGFVSHWDGATWSLASTPLTSGATVATGYSSIWGSGANDIWVAGSAAGATTGALIHWNGSTWTNTTLANLSGTRALWGSGPTDVWMWAYFLGSAAESLMHWNGSAWSTSMTLPDVWSYGNAMSGTGPADLWAVGSGGMILHHS